MAERKESVRLELIDEFTPQMVRAAAAAALLKRELDGDGQSFKSAGSEMDNFSRKANSSGASIDKLSGRMSILVRSAAALGPSLIPIGAQAIPLMAGFANELGIAALAGGTAVLAFHGVGDALKAVNTYQVTPTTANLAKMNAALHAIGPAGATMVRELESLEPVFKSLQRTAQAGLFPGVTEGLQSVITLAPKVKDIISTVAKASGELAAEAGKGLAGPGFASFFDYIDREARPTLLDLGHALGNVAEGLANLWVAFAPLESSFSQGFLHMSQSFNAWADGLSKTKGFQDFVDYIQTNGPQVLSTLGSLGNALVQIVQAAAPIGGPVLHAITAFANAVAALADSPLGTPLFGAVSALSAYTLAAQVAGAANTKFFLPLKSGVTDLKGQSAGLRDIAGDFSILGTTAFASGSRGRDALLKFGKGAAVLGGVGVVASGLADKLGLTNTATLALAGSMAGPEGAAIGGIIGLTLDATKATEQYAKAIAQVQAAQGSAVGSTQYVAALKAGNDALSHFTSVSGGAQLGLSGLANLASFGHMGESISGAVTQVDKLQMALEDLQNVHSAPAGGLATFLTAGLNPAVRQTAAAMDLAAQSGKDFEATLSAIDGRLSKTDAWLSYKGAVLATAAALKQNGDTADANTSKGQANLQALQAQAHAIDAYASKLSAADRGPFLARATKSLFASANQIDKTGKTADRLRASFGLLGGTTAKPKVSTDTAAATHKIQTFGQYLAALSKKKATPTAQLRDLATADLRGINGLLSGLNGRKATVSIITKHIAEDIHKTFGFGAKPSADGSMVPKDGGPYTDRFLYMLAPGEEIIPNRHGEADHYRAMRAAYQIPGLAAGGTVGARHRGVLPDYDTLRGATA